MVNSLRWLTRANWKAQRLQTGKWLAENFLSWALGMGPWLIYTAHITFINELLNSLCKFLQLITKYMLRSASYSKGFRSLWKWLNMELVTRFTIYWKIKKEQLLYNTVASYRLNSEFQIENPVCLEVFLFIIFKKMAIWHHHLLCIVHPAVIPIPTLVMSPLWPNNLKNI